MDVEWKPENTRLTFFLFFMEWRREEEGRWNVQNGKNNPTVISYSS